MENYEQKKEKYHKDYDNLERFISYYCQTSIVLKAKPKKVLEVGCGNKTFYNYIKEKGIKITSCDANKKLNPDVVGDIRKLPFKDKEFDTVTAFQILEHLSFDEVATALKELKRVSKNKVIISIPYSNANIDFVISLSFLFLKKKVRILIRMPYFFINMKVNKSKEHFWEMGRSDYPKRKIRKLLRRFFVIEKEFTPYLNSYHYFFVLKKIDL